MAKPRVLFIGGSGVISSPCSRVAVQGARQIADWYLADPARQVTAVSLDAVMDKLVAAWII
jgi:hypothetical protein